MSNYEEHIQKWKESVKDSAHIGVDLDATLAHYDGWHGPTHIGAPIQLMVERIKKWLASGVKVKIFTARVSEPDPVVRATIVDVIQDYTEKHIGVRLEVTNQKTYDTIEYWDDRAVQVIPNTGLRADGVSDHPDMF